MYRQKFFDKKYSNLLQELEEMKLLCDSILEEVTNEDALDGLLSILKDTF
jgi:hypothetical protein